MVSTHNLHVKGPPAKHPLCGSRYLTWGLALRSCRVRRVISLRGSEKALEEEPLLFIHACMTSGPMKAEVCVITLYSHLKRVYGMRPHGEPECVPSLCMPT
jgi:hypothetical protein